MVEVYTDYNLRKLFHGTQTEPVNGVYKFDADPLIVFRKLLEFYPFACWDVGTDGVIYNSKYQHFRLLHRGTCIGYYDYREPAFQAFARRISEGYTNLAVVHCDGVIAMF